jgi:hypothetical protein
MEGLIVIRDWSREERGVFIHEVFKIGLKGFEM